MSKNKLLLVDGENLLHRSFHKFEKLKASDGKPSGAIFGFFKSLHYLTYRFRPTHLIVTFDNGHSKYRTSICKEYKSHRKSISVDYDSLHSQKRVIMKMLKYLGIQYIFDNDRLYEYEGDDYIALLKHLFKEKVIIVSSDKDFCQLICKRVKLFNTGKDVLINIHNCKEVMGYSPEECVDYLSLVGDSSDDIKGYPGIGPVKARKFLDDWKSIHNFFLSPNNTFKGIDNETLYEVYQRNNAMINLTWFIKKYPIDNIPIFSNKRNLDKFNKILIEYSLNSLRSKEFIETFEKIKTWKKE